MHLTYHHQDMRQRIWHP